VTYIRCTTERALLMSNAMAESPRTVAQLVELSGLSKQAVARWLKAVRGNVHIAGYTEDARGRVFAPMWAYGAGVDAPRPGCARSAAERMRDVRRRRKDSSGDDLFE